MEWTAMPELIANLQDPGACDKAVEWIATQPDPQTAWQTCDHPRWLLWYADQCGVEHSTFVRIACECARTCLPFVPAGEERPRRTIEAAEQWIVGEATISDLQVAAATAHAAAVRPCPHAAADADAAYAAASAEYAARTAHDGIEAAYSAVSYAIHAARVGGADPRAAAIAMCDIIRSIVI